MVVVVAVVVVVVADVAEGTVDGTPSLELLSVGTTAGGLVFTVDLSAITGGGDSIFEGSFGRLKVDVSDTVDVV